MDDFLGTMALSDTERTKLTNLGATTPMALLSLRKASKEAFDAHVGPDRAEAIANEAYRYLTDEERTRLAEPVKPGGSLGARFP